MKEKFEDTKCESELIRRNDGTLAVIVRHPWGFVNTIAVTEHPTQGEMDEIASRQMAEWKGRKRVNLIADLKREPKKKFRDRQDIMEELEDSLQEDAAAYAWDEMFGDWTDKDVGIVFNSLRRKGEEIFMDGLFALLEYAIRKKKIKLRGDLTVKTSGLPEPVIEQLKALADKKGWKREDDVGEIWIHSIPIQPCYIDQDYLSLQMGPFMIDFQWLARKRGEA